MVSEAGEPGATRAPDASCYPPTSCPGSRMFSLKKWIAVAVIAAIPALSLAADAWPNKPITYVVPFAPGGNTDTLARIIGPKLSTALGQPIVVENKPGAGGNIGSDFVAKSKPAGYTILGGTITSHAINACMYPNI